MKNNTEGFKGACHACEPVGELNKKLQSQLEVLTKCSCDPELHHGNTFSLTICNGCLNKEMLEIK